MGSSWEGWVGEGSDEIEEDLRADKALTQPQHSGKTCLSSPKHFQQTDSSNLTTELFGQRYQQLPDNYPLQG